MNEDSGDVKRLTVSYDQLEDRIVFDIQAEREPYVRLWLTRRLLCRLMVHLHGIIGDQGCSVGNLSNNAEAEHIEIEHGRYVSLLVREVDVTESSKLFALVFRGLETEISANLRLSVSALRQLLSHLDDLFGVAKWPKGEWQYTVKSSHQDAERNYEFTVH